MMNKKIIGIMALAVMLVVGVCPAFAATQSNATQSVTVTVNPTVSISVDPLDFGALDADGLTTTKKSTVTSKSNVAIDVWVKALAFQANQTVSDPLALEDLTFDAGTPFSSTDYTKSVDLTNIPRAKRNTAQTKDLRLNINVPFGTDAATYNTTVYYAAVQTGKTPI